MTVDVPVVRPARITESTHISEAMVRISIARDGFHELIAEEDDDSSALPIVPSPRQTKPALVLHIYSADSP